MSDGMTEAYRRTVITKKINKNVSVDIDLRNKAVRITNDLSGKEGVELKIKTLQKILELINAKLEE